jgi:hypothetical protein
MSRASRVEPRSAVRSCGSARIRPEVSLIEQQLANFPAAIMCSCMEGKVSTPIEAETVRTWKAFV